jgi:hypothetical protein
LADKLRLANSACPSPAAAYRALLAGGLGVEPAGQVFQAGVDLDVMARGPGPSRRARPMAAARFAPVEGPERMPSVRAAWRAVWNA